LQACDAAFLRRPECVQVPTNGLVVYTGTILTDDGKEKRVNIDFEPFKPINTSLYLCDNKFHTEALQELLECDAKCDPLLFLCFFFFCVIQLAGSQIAL
jgi:peptide chain release factor subunit 1